MSERSDAVIARAFWRSLGVGCGLAAAIGAGWWWTRPGSSPVAPVLPSHIERDTPAAKPVVEPALRFRDIAKAAGIDFVHANGAAGDKLLPETMGSGVAFFDLENDGDPDLLFINGRAWPDASATRSPTTPALYRNDGSGYFENITESAGLNVSDYGMGVAVGDVDDDGFVDIFVTALGRNRLWRNEAGERFVDVTEVAGVGGEASAWSTAAAFFDAEDDGDLDLFVGNYVQWSRAIDFAIDFQLAGIGRAYGPPTGFAGTQPYFYRNLGDGRFEEVAQAAGLHVHNAATGEAEAKTLAVVPVDFDADGRMDLLVANDTIRNFAFRNLGGGQFEEVGIAWGLAFDRDGRATGAMGIDAAEYGNDRRLGVAIGNFANEMSSLYVLERQLRLFIDEAIGEGIGAASRAALTFGVLFFDADLDGRLDLLQANGHIEERIHEVQASQTYRQKPQLFWNCGEPCPHTFHLLTATEGLAEEIVGRGAAYADIDADGDLDLALTQNGGAPLLLRNEQETGHHWLRLTLIGTRTNRNAIGTWVEVRAGGVVQRQQVMPSRSYLSQVELPLTFGLGETKEIDTLRIEWPSGQVQELSQGITPDRLTLVEEMP